MALTRLSSLRKDADRMTDSAEESYTLPARYFFDPGIYQREKELIFFKNWWFVGHVSELPQPGSYLTCQIFDQSILVIRGADNVIRAFYNVCTHRAYELVQGKGNARSFVCAYHAWSFDTKGCLRSANHESYVKGFRKSDYNLPEVKVCEFGKFIYVNLDPNAVDLNELAGGFAQECRDAIPGYDDLQFIRRDRFEVKANWKVVVDNFLECYHCPVAHPLFMGSKDSLSTRSFDGEEHEYYSTHIMRSGRPNNKAYKFNATDAIQDGYIWALWPNTLFMTWPAPSNLFVFHVIPNGPESTLENFDLYTLANPPGETEMAMFDYHARIVNGEDVGVCEGVQRGIHSRGYNQGRLMINKDRSWWSEHAVHHFEHQVWKALNPE
jgi:phenylpropionate dioxygenase-like ring-hydroxylating dioxygenase large terminal subunit